jgi:hypothetical protein
VYGPHNLTTATLLNRLASTSTTALTKWVVPIATFKILLRSTLDSSRTFSMAVLMPSVTLGVVGVLQVDRTPHDLSLRERMSRIALSVLVPPTSTPVRYIVKFFSYSLC